MKWVSQQLTLPILLTFSVTGVSLALLYLVHKKEQEIKDAQEKKRGSKRLTEKLVQIPREFVPVIIGRGGSTMQDIQEKTSTEIHFEKDNIDYPFRNCTVKGEAANIEDAEELIKSIIANRPIIETYEFYVPQKACDRVIGRCGESLHRIQMTSSAKIIIDSSYVPKNPNAERRVIIKGTAEQIANALSQLEDKIREDKEARMKIEAASASRLPRGKLSPHSTASSSSDHLPSTESLSVQSPSGSMEVYVSAMESPNLFWVQLVGSGTTALNKLISEMTEYYNDEENREIHILKNVSPGQIVAARFSFDDQWYRAEVVAEVENGGYEVHFLDYGDREVVDVKSLFELRTDFLSVRLQAIECCLANVKPRDNNWSNEACDRFTELTWLAQWKVLVAKVRGYKERALGYGRCRREGSPIPCVELFDKNDNKDINIGLELVNEGFAELEETISSRTSSTLSLSTRSHDFLAVSSPMSTSPQPERIATPRGQNTSAKAQVEEIDITTSPETKVQEIDLTTPRKVIEEIDLVTPLKDESVLFLENEKKYIENTGYLRNGNKSFNGTSSNGNTSKGRITNFKPADYDSDDDDDAFDMG